MPRKVRAKCDICGETVFPSGYGKGAGRNAHLKDNHPDAQGGYRKNFSFVELDLGKKVKTPKTKKVKKGQIKAQEGAPTVPEKATVPA